VVASGRRSVTRGEELTPRRTAPDPHGGDLFPLLVRARQGEPVALPDLLCSLRGCLRAQISRRLRGGWTEAWIEDVVQESLLDAFRGLRECRAHSEGELRAWARTIARRQVASLIRHEAPRLESAVPLSTLPAVADTDPPDPSPRLRSLLAALADAVEDLSPSQSYLLWARLQTDATWSETGAELGIAASAAKRRYQRLIASLRRRCVRIQA
jgi:RNA polymerase sigma factor (sigma-70 family)